MFVSYSRKGDRTYARLVTSRRVDGKVVKETSNLGRVVDREGHVFRSRERGTFTFDPRTGEFGPAPSGGWPRPAERLVLDFGDAWATSEGLWSALDAASPADPDGPGCLCVFCQVKLSKNRTRIRAEFAPDLGVCRPNPVPPVLVARPRREGR